MALLRGKKYLQIAILAVILAVVVYLAWPSNSTPTDASQQNTPASSASSNTPSFNKQQYSLSDPASIWVVVNKQRPLSPVNYVPADLVVPNVPLRVPGNESMQLRNPATQALEKMFAAAKADGVPMMLSSGYRSYSYQVALYNSYVSSQGQAKADVGSARPGYSEHQTGLAADIEPLNEECDLGACFAKLPAGKWLAANAYKYGFIMRYPSDKVSVTGYEYEPWHFRYVGKALSNEMHMLHIKTLEEFFGLPAAPNY